MKITMIGPVYPYRGGIAHYTTLLVKALVDSHNVQVISFSRQYPGWLYPGKSDQDPSQYPLLVDADYCLDSINPLSWWQTAHKIQCNAPDIAVFQWWTPFMGPAYSLLAYLLKRTGIPSIFLIHNVLPHETRPVDRGLALLALRQAEAFIVQTGREKERLLNLIPKAKIDVCPHPLYDMFSEQKITREGAIQRLGLPHDLPILLFFGIVRPYKGLRVALEAVANLRDGGKKVFLVVAGEFWEDRQGYEQLINELGIRDQVYLDDRYIPNEQVPVYFSAADVFVAPYLHGTQSGAVKLAMGFGLPVVVTQSIVEEHFLTMGDDCRIIPPGDKQALAAGILETLEHPCNRNLSQRQSNGWEEISLLFAQMGHSQVEQVPTISTNLID
jgi:glycosyltransferase involved in cell wall biosynthesis